MRASAKGYMSDDGLSAIKDGELLKWEKEGSEVYGLLKSYRPQKTAMGEGNVYEVQTKDGLVPFFAPTLLHRKLQQVPVGQIVKIKYTKKTKTGAGTDLKHFEVANGPATAVSLAAAGLDAGLEEIKDEEKQF